MTIKIQINDEIRDATADEIKVIEQQQDDAEAQNHAFQAAATAKTSARAKLKALGLTDAEISALVG